MMNRKRLSYITALLILLLSTALLSGCQLAVETGAAAEQGDRLCGILVTFRSAGVGGAEAADLSDTSVSENYYDLDPWSKLNTDKVEGKLIGEVYHIEFDGIDGFYLGFINYFDDNLKTNVPDVGFYDSKYGTYNTNEGVTHTLEASLYVSLDFNTVADANPVYARPDGSYYVIRGVMSSVLPTPYEDSPTSISQEASYTTSIDGVSSTVKDSFKVNIVPTRRTKQLFIKEMNKADELIKTTEYFADSPDEFTVDKDTEYIIVEEWMESANNKAHIDRSIYSLEAKVEGIGHRCSFSDKTGVIGLTNISFKKN